MVYVTEGYAAMVGKVAHFTIEPAARTAEDDEQAQTHNRSMANYFDFVMANRMHRRAWEHATTVARQGLQQHPAGRQVLRRQ